MSTSAAFDFASAELERGTSLSAIEARGTIRLALKSAGLDAATVTAAQLAVVAARVLPKELGARRVEDADAVCAAIQNGLAGLGAGEAARTSTDDVFERLGG